MKLIASRCFLALAILAFASTQHVSAEEYYVAAGGWECNTWPMIDDIKKSSINMEYLKNYCHLNDECGYSASVMRVDGKYAYLCALALKVPGQPNNYIPTINCNYALISDIRDSKGSAVTADQLKRETIGKTMNDLRETRLMTKCWLQSLAH